MHLRIEFLDRRGYRNAHYYYYYQGTSQRRMHWIGLQYENSLLYIISTGFVSCMVHHKYVHVVSCDNHKDLYEISS